MPPVSWQGSRRFYCEELQHVVEIFEVDLNTYNRYANAIDREIGLIKKWRQSDNKIKSYLQGSI